MLKPIQIYERIWKIEVHGKMVWSGAILYNERSRRHLHFCVVRPLWWWKNICQQHVHKSIVSENHYWEVIIKQFFDRTRRRENFNGKFKLTTGENRGVFNVRYDLLPTFLNFEVLPDFIQSYNTTVTILHTDYDNFAILWSCTNIRQYGHVENAWLLTRDQFPTEDVLQSSYGFLDKFGLRNFFIKSNQENCDPWKQFL